MDVIEKKQFWHQEMQRFDMKLSYVEITRDSPNNEYNSHVHPECEIYVNLSGDVSFMVENRIYPVLPGSIVITRPYEYHHCIYHSNALHKHFWILFSPNGNEHLLSRFFDRPAGSGNLLLLPSDQQKALFDLCREMLDREDGALLRQYRFLKMLCLLESATPAPTEVTSSYPDVDTALAYLEKHYALPITVSELAALSHVSVNTLERHFEAVLHLSPSVYLKKKRLGIAAELLYRGATVSEACRNSGFSDDSRFIALFKKTYGVTPLKYREEVRK